MTLEFLAVRAGPRAVDYLDGWDLQRRVHAEVAAGQRPDTVILLEHASVYTAGKRTEASERPTDGTPVVDVDRGGKITWHGPGQLVGYPIVRLPGVGLRRRLRPAPGGGDHLALHRLRADHRSGAGPLRGVAAGRPSEPVDRLRAKPERKIAAIGIRVAAGVTMHGFAINVDPDLGWFDRIVPCGIADAGVTSLAAETGALRPPAGRRGRTLSPAPASALALRPVRAVGSPDRLRPASPAAELGQVG